MLTRQGNPAWANINGDGSDGPFRGDDMFHNGTDPDWVNLDKVAIPQADEQQRLLANVLTETTRDALPLPRFWYLPRGEVAALVMTADEHNGGSVTTRMNAENAASPAGCSVDDWECIRSTSYLYPDYPSMSAAQASTYEDQGFEIALHPNTGCASPTRAGFESLLTTQLADLRRDVPRRRPIDHQPQPLHRVGGLHDDPRGARAKGHPPRHQLLLLARRLGGATGPACSPAPASRSGSPPPAAT